MSTSKHTSGPYIWMDDAHTAASARQIAAPDLLETLEQTAYRLHAIANSPYRVPQEIRDAAKEWGDEALAALRKARGEAEAE